MSMGGYFAPRAAAFEERIDGVVAYDTCYDFGAVAGPLLAAAKNPVAMKNIGVSWAYRNALWTMGTKDADETAKACATYTLAPVADRIRQDVLMLAGTEDHFIPFHQTADFEKALAAALDHQAVVADRVRGRDRWADCGRRSNARFNRHSWARRYFKWVNWPERLRR